MTMTQTRENGRARTQPKPPQTLEDHLRVGAHGILARERNCLIEVRASRPTWNEVGSFEGYVDGRQRALLRYQEEMMAVTLADDLHTVELKKGDLLGFNREGARLAY